MSRTTTQHNRETCTEGATCLVCYPTAIPRTATAMTDTDPSVSWIPTKELRFVQRRKTYNPTETVAVLQQRWAKYYTTEIGMYFDREFEWRDVPTVEE